MSNQATMTALTEPQEAIASLLESLGVVGTEWVDLIDATGRVLAKDVTTDRPSPPCDCSAMDGYAVRFHELSLGWLPVEGEAIIGCKPPALKDGHALRIFTGGPIPDGTDTVVRREDTQEEPDRVRLAPDAQVHVGDHIRRRAENAPAGERVVGAGRMIDAVIASALGAFGRSRVEVFGPVRLGVLLTGDELLGVDQAPEPWQIRDSNGATLRAMFATWPSVRIQSIERIADHPERLREAIRVLLPECDVIVLTGGVSVGDHDHVLGAVRSVGAQILFHKLAIRPGKPMLGAVGPGGQAILGLPGNPMAVQVTARRFASVAVRRLGGFSDPDPPPSMVELVEPADRAIKLWWYRPVRVVEPGRAELLLGRGSGDLVSSARSDGFVVMPPNQRRAGPWPYYPWG